MEICQISMFICGSAYSGLSHRQYDAHMLVGFNMLRRWRCQLHQSGFLLCHCSTVVYSVMVIHDLQSKESWMLSDPRLWYLP